MFVKYNANYRNYVVGVDTKVPTSSGQLVTAINFDNAATTPPFVSVMNAINSFAPWYSSIHRGTGYKSQYSSKVFEESRKVIADFVNADCQYNTVVYVKNTTEAINKLANRLCRSRKCVVLSTDMEHHSNDLPWRNKYTVDYIKIDESGALSLEDLERKLVKYKNSVKLVTVAGASNVTGYVNPIHQIAAIAHKYNAKLLVDGAQLVPHVKVDMKPVGSPEHIDYLVFSAHKMYAPFGIGVLIAPTGDFELGDPDYVGGGTIDLVTHEYVKWADPPHKDEAGTPNIMGVIALAEAIRTLTALGMENAERYELSLTEYALGKLRAIPDIELYGNTVDCKGRLGIIPFNIKGMHHDITAAILSYEAGIAVRNGCFCAQPYVQKLLNIPMSEITERLRRPWLPRPGMVRISFGLYNTYHEIDVLAAMLETIVKNKDRYLQKYSYLSGQQE